MLFVVALILSQAVWKGTEHDAALRSGRSYTAAVNLMWCAVRRLISPGVPITEGAIDVMIQTHWAAGPTKFPGELCIGLLKGSESASDFAAQKGNLMRLSPEEKDHSLLIHIGNRIHDGAEQHELEQRVRTLAIICKILDHNTQVVLNMSLSEALHRCWRTTLLTVSCKVMVFETMDDALFQSINDRNANIGTYDACVRSTVQLIFEVAAFRTYYTNEHNKKLTLQELADLWIAKVKDTGSQLQEKVGFSWIEAGMKVYDRMLKEPELYEIIMDLQNRYTKNSCLNSIKNLEAISIKGRTFEERLWILRCVQDYLLSGTSNSEFGSRLMTPSKSGGGPAGMLDMFIAKLQMRDYFVDRWCSDKGFDGKSITMLRELRTHAEFRAKCGGGWAEQSADVSWQGCRMECERRAVSFLKDSIFGPKNDSQLRQIIRGTTVPAEIFEKNPYSEALERIQQALEDLQVDVSTKQTVEGGKLGSAEDEEGTELLAELLQIESKTSFQAVPEDKQGELRTWLVRCQEHVNHFVRFVVNEVDTVSALASLMGNSCLSAELRNPKAKALFRGMMLG